MQNLDTYQTQINPKLRFLMAIIEAFAVTTVENQEKSILQLLRSLEKQTLKPWEAIILDGVSTDCNIDAKPQYASKNSLKRLSVIC